MSDFKNVTFIIKGNVYILGTWSHVDRIEVQVQVLP